MTSQCLNSHKYMIYRKLTTKEIFHRNQKRRSPLSESFIIWLHNIRSMHNVGAVFRNSDAFGIHELWLSGYTPAPPRPEISKTAIGAEEHVSWRSFTGYEEPLDRLRENNYLLLGLEQADNGILLNRYKQDGRPICLLLGNEVTGISEELLPHLDGVVEIPQFGVKHSLNVSVASGVALYAFFEKFHSDQESNDKNSE